MVNDLVELVDAGRSTDSLFRRIFVWGSPRALVRNAIVPTARSRPGRRVLGGFALALAECDGLASVGRRPSLGDRRSGG